MRLLEAQHGRRPGKRERTAWRGRYKYIGVRGRNDGTAVFVDLAHKKNRGDRNEKGSRPFNQRINGSSSQRAVRTDLCAIIGEWNREDA